MFITFAVYAQVHKRCIYIHTKTGTCTWRKVFTMGACTRVVVQRVAGIYFRAGRRKSVDYELLSVASVKDRGEKRDTFLFMGEFAPRCSQTRNEERTTEREREGTILDYSRYL